MLLPVPGVSARWDAQGIMDGLRDLRSMCVFIWGCGAFPKSPEVPGGCTPTPMAGVKLDTGVGVRPPDFQACFPEPLGSATTLTQL